MKHFKFNERQRFSIRKFSVGVASVLLGSVFVAISPLSAVQANEANEANPATTSTDTLSKIELKNLIDEIDGKFANGTYANKTEESVTALKRVLEDARATLTSATAQDQLTTAYRRLLMATTNLKTKSVTKIVEEPITTPKVEEITETVAKPEVETSTTETVAKPESATEFVTTPNSQPEKATELKEAPAVDTTNGQPTVGKKAENTEPKAGTNSIANTGSHDPRNGKAMDRTNPLRTGEPASTPTTDDPYNSFVFSGNDTDFKNHSTLKWFSKEGDGNNRNNESLKYGEDSHGKYVEWKSSQSRGGGFKLTIDKELGEEYTIGVKFAYDRTTSEPSIDWRKIIDYRNSSEDTGFYFTENGKLQFYNTGAEKPTSTSTVSDNEVVDFIIVKSKEEFAVYLVKNGTTTKEFSTKDPATLTNSKPYTKDGKTIFGFFFDDNVTSAEATPGGRVYRMSIYDKAIDPNKVSEKLNKELDDSKYEPELKNPLPDVKKGSTPPNAEDFIKNTPTSNEPKKLPANTRITWGEAPDTSTVGLKPAVILVTYPDGSSDRVGVKVNVVNNDFTPSKPAKTPVGDVNHLTTDEVNKIKKAVEDVNAGKTVTVDETGKATVTDPTTHISHEIPASDLKVQDFTVAIPVNKLLVEELGNLTIKETEDLKAKVEEANPGKNVTVDVSGKVTVTDKITQVSHVIPASNLTKKEEEVAKPNAGNNANTPAAKTVISKKDPLTPELTPDEKKEIADKVKAVNPDADPTKPTNVVVDEKGNATVVKGDGTVLYIPASDLVIPTDKLEEKAKAPKVKTPALRTLVGDKENLTDTEKGLVTGAIKAVNPGATLVEDEKGNVTVTLPNGSTETIAKEHLVKDKDEAKSKNGGNNLNINLNLDLTKVAVDDIEKISKDDKDNFEFMMLGAITDKPTFDLDSYLKTQDEQGNTIYTSKDTKVKITIDKEGNATIEKDGKSKVAVQFDKEGNATIVTEEGKVLALTKEQIFKQRPSAPQHNDTEVNPENSNANVDKGKLESAIHQLDEFMYHQSDKLDENSTKKAKALLEDGKKVFADSKASQEEVDTTVKRIEDFIAKFAKANSDVQTNDVQVDDEVAHRTENAEDVSLVANVSKRVNQQELPNTGTSTFETILPAIAALLSGAGVLAKKKKEDE